MSLQEDKTPPGHCTDLFDKTSTTPTPPHLHWGNRMEPKDERTLRLYFQNINGLPTNDNWAEWNYITSYWKPNKIDIAGLAETNLKWTKQTTATARKHLAAQVRFAMITTTSCDEPTTYIYQRGGVLTATLGSLTGRIGGPGREVRGLGRWSYVQFQGRQRKSIIVMTSYRVAKNNLTRGDNTAYNQQYKALRRQGVDNPKPKKTFLWRPSPPYTKLD